MNPGGVGGAPARRAKATSATGGGDIENLYGLELDKKVDCLRSMDRVQWNQQVTSQLDNNDATEALLRSNNLHDLLIRFSLLQVSVI